MRRGRQNDILFRIFMRASRTLCSEGCPAASRERGSKAGRVSTCRWVDAGMKWAEKKRNKKKLVGWRGHGEHRHLPSGNVREDIRRQRNRVCAMWGVLSNLGVAAEWRKKQSAPLRRRTWERRTWEKVAKKRRFTQKEQGARASFLLGVVGSAHIFFFATTGARGFSLVSFLFHTSASSDSHLGIAKSPGGTHASAEGGQTRRVTAF